MLDERVILAIVTSIEPMIEYKERHNTEIKQYKTLNFHDSLDSFERSFFLGFL